MPRKPPLELPSPAGGAATGPDAKSGGKRSAGRATPMMGQFQAAKKEHPDALLFFRMGDFYELFGEDAVVASKALGITLTSRAKGTDALPMAGVPVRSVESYLLRLVEQGFKVAICEQLSDPRTTKGIVDRGVVRVVTPGTITEEDVLDRRRSNFLASLWCGRDSAGLAWVDVSTGRFLASEVPIASVADELGRIAPAELLLADSLGDAHGELLAELRSTLAQRVTTRDAWRFARDASLRTLRRHFRVATLEGYGLADESSVVPAAGALVEYLEETQRSACEHVRRIERVVPSEHLVLDRATRTCLELVRTQRGEKGAGTLLEAIDTTLTPMGGRLLFEWVLAPLCDVEAIRDRQRGVAELHGEPFLREELRALLEDVQDVERLVAKVSTGRANARDLLALASSLATVPPVRAKLADPSSEVLARLREELDPLEDVAGRIRATIAEDPPPTLRDGGLIRAGVSDELDDYRRVSGDGKSAMAGFQAREIETTGIQGLKIGYNSVFGYYIEVPRGQLARVPDEWTRKQTIKNAERYVTPELKEFETKVLRSEELSKDLEYRLFCELRDAVAAEIGRILDTAHALAQIDVLAALAQAAADHRYVAPEVDDGDVIEVIDGRHPVIEQSAACEAFVPNDSTLDLFERNVTILTGPNMAGKSTYIRQVALITLLAQIGSFVPAAEARIGVVDRIFTRVGSGDDISRGASTFMVEMVEIANILNHASRRSLVILDEVGRGTSTFDGLALAWAIVEHLHDRIGARTLFATHYHQLTDLASRHQGVCNRSVAVREWGEEIVFLHKIVEGGTDRSYGIHVARLAGVPPELLERARRILSDLEEDAEGLAPRIEAHRDELTPAPRRPEGQQLALFAAEPSAVERALRAIDVDATTPIEALLELRKLREMLGD